MVYTNLDAVAAGQHGIFESSNLKATTVGNIYDCLVTNGQSGSSEATLDVDNGVALFLGEYTGEGLQERKATIATVKQEIAVTGAPAVVKDAMTNQQAQANNFYTKAGKLVKTYEVVKDDIFAIADYQFTSKPSGGLAKDQYVVINGTGGWVAQAAVPTSTSYGFIGKIHSVSVGTYYTVVRIRCIQNATQA